MTTIRGTKSKRPNFAPFEMSIFFKAPNGSIIKSRGHAWDVFPGFGNLFGIFIDSKEMKEKMTKEEVKSK